MTSRIGETEGLLRRCAPQALGAVARRFGNFADAEDAVQEAMIAAAEQWPAQGIPESPTGWLIHVASRRMLDRIRSDESRRGRESLAAVEEPPDPPPVPDSDDSLALVLMCCHPALSPASAVALTLRAVGGLTTAEIAAAFIVPEKTMAQRISRAKGTIEASGVPFAVPSPAELPDRLRSTLRVLYLIFNEGYVTSGGATLARAELSEEAIRLTRTVHTSLPGNPEAAGLLALMLLTEARREARSDGDGELIPLAEQDRSLWDRERVKEGLEILAAAAARGALGEYQLQAGIAAAHDQAASAEETDWVEITGLYTLLERITPNPMVSLNRAIAVAMVEGPEAGLRIVDGLETDLGASHRWHSTRAHLLELSGEPAEAKAAFARAAELATSAPEQHYLVKRAARLDGAWLPAD